MINKTKIIKVLATINFILPFVGYQLVTTIFFTPQTELVDSGISQVVTIPYRAFALFVSLIVILLVNKSKIKRPSTPMIALLIYWLILILRITYDTQIKLALVGYDTTQLWLFVFGICLPVVVSVYLSSKFIDYNKALYAIFTSFLIILIITLFNNQLLYTGAENLGRQDANLALNTISYGHLGVSTFIIGLFIIKFRNNSLLIKIIIFLISLLGIYSTLRSGSRGPVVSIFVVALFYVFSRQKKPLLGFVVLLLTFLALIVFLDSILNFFESIAPIIATRLRETLYEGDSSYREIIYAASFEKFLDAPLFGSQFAHFGRIAYQELETGFIYSHNIILDALMGMGIFGGGLMMYILYSAIKRSYLNIKFEKSNFWISLLLIQSIVSHMFSSAFYYDPLLSALLVVHFSTSNHTRKDNKNGITSIKN